MRPNETQIGFWRGLRTGQIGVGSRIALSLACGLLLFAAGLAAAWLVPHLKATTRGAGSGGFRPRLRDEELFLILGVTGISWCLLLAFLWGTLWRSQRRRWNRLLAPALCTLALGIATVVGSLLIDHWVRNDEEILIAAFCLVMGACAILLWLPALHRLFAPRPVLNAEDQVNVHCPACGYTLIGLQELRCPECGTRFTIDELIRAQNYGGAAPVKPRGPDADLLSVRPTNSLL